MAKDKTSRDELSDLRKRAENALQEKSSVHPDVSTLPTEELQKLVHELEVHQIELQMQNEELLRTQRELGESLNRYQDLYDFAPVAYVTLDTKGIVREANLTAVGLLGVDRKLLIGKPLSSFVHELDYSVYYVKLVQVLETRENQTCELRIAPQKGDMFHALLEGRSVKDQDGKVTRTRIILSDITDRIRAEKEKESLRTQLFQSQKMEALGTLVGGIAHDFNNMLQIMMGYCDLLLSDKQKGEPGYQELQTIAETGKGGAELVKKLLAFGQQGQIFSVPLDLNHQISQLATLLSHTLPHVVQVDLDLIDGPTTIRADHGQIDQLVMNLAINASEAMPIGGRLKIATTKVSLDDEYCRTHYGAKPGRYVMLTVSDTGRGMDQEILVRIFDPFFSTKERGSTRGTGLGLSVVKGIVQQQGGHVTCESEPGKGTTVKVYFPAVEAPLITAKTVLQTVQSEGTETILVVEDNIPVAELERKVLANAGYEVIVATNGKEALDIYKTRKKEISLVILDLLMPEMSGRDCLMELLKIDPSVKVLIASGYAPEDELHKEISPLVKGFLHKPFAISALPADVRSVLDSD
jgi:two-component system, cell cycle sensor histidine kinase and response regulator CckA